MAAICSGIALELQHKSSDQVLKVECKNALNTSLTIAV